MATTNESAAGSRSNATSQADAATDAMEKQIAQLRREITRINKTLAEQAEDAGEAVSGWYDSAADRASRAVTSLGNQAKGVSGAVRENPGTVSTAMLLGGGIGLLIGLMLNQHNSRDYGWFDRR